ncbi:hypothetical protein AB0M43_23310 [Longispora sp. NPDC051575]|uniref:hypothetical protein n=1 Tax=Longispora sp. NPDC051575 TaxID=3154943 RepID=UPI00343CE1E9
MSLFAALAKVDALAVGRAQPIAGVRHVYLSGRPLVLIPLALAGEAAAPLAMMLGTDRADPRLLVVPQPRDRALRAAFFDDLSRVVTALVGDLATTPEQETPETGTQGSGLSLVSDSGGEHPGAPGPLGSDGARPVTVVPSGLEPDVAQPAGAAADELAGPDVQVLVPNRSGVDFLRLLGRATRFRDGDRIGRWLTFLADRSEHPDSCLLLPVTEALTGHWATGQSAVEDAHLASVLAWIDGAPEQVVPDEAASTAGPQTDPDFDNKVLAPLIDAYDAGDPEAAPQIAKAVGALLEPVWAQVWHAVDLLRALPEARSVPERWLWDVSEYAGFVAGHLPQPVRDSPVAAAARLDRLERTQARVEAQRAFDDPLVMAGHQLTGAAFRGTVVATEPDRKEGRKLRPRITVETVRPVHLRGAVTSPARRAQAAEITEVDGLRVVLTLTSGMGRGAVPAAGSVPEVGEELVYTSLSETFQRPAAFPDETPWTHGG